MGTAPHRYQGREERAGAILLSRGFHGLGLGFPASISELIVHRKEPHPPLFLVADTKDHKAHKESPEPNYRVNDNSFPPRTQAQPDQAVWGALWLTFL